MHADTRTNLIAQAEAWLAVDPDPESKARVRAWIDAADHEALASAFAQRLQFGTAGLRGLLGPGPAHMNRMLVRRVARGLADHLGEGLVLVGADARRGSAQFLEDACGALQAAGMRVLRFPDPVPTPLVAFACRRLAADAAIVITASHNPPEYNGIKVYAAHGRQIVPPQDAAISAAIDAVEGCPPVAGPPAPQVDPSLFEDYLEEVALLRRQPQLELDLDVVYTPMHGVGGHWMREMLARHGVRVEVVEEQFEPDGEFPTVRFPNPEEKGALDLARAKAARTGGDLILANDPDADRLAVGVRAGDGHRMLSGNELGALLGEYLLRFDRGEAKPLVMTTIVSSRLLQRIAAHHDAHYAETLTGFKWIAEGAERHAREHGSRFVLGYEEALGYTVDRVVADKDGIATALVVCEMAAWCKLDGRTLIDFLDEIQRREGRHLSHQHSMTLPGEEGRARIVALMRKLRENPPPAALEPMRDYSVGLDGLPPADVLAMDFRGGGRVLARPSGTEPKIKFYFELAGKEPDLEERLQRLVRDFLEYLA